MVLVDINTLKYKGIKPSSELKLHTKIYQDRPDVNAVIHTHQMMASIVGVAHMNLPILNPEYAKILGADEIITAAYAMTNTTKLTIYSSKALGKNNAAILANHGVVCAGKTLEQVFVCCQVLEKACEEFIELKKSKNGSI
jgi:L-fuculose-phosphate aldolase